MKRHQIITVPKRHALHQITLLSWLKSMTTFIKLSDQLKMLPTLDEIFVIKRGRLLEQGSRSARLSPQSMIHYARKLFKCSKNSTGFHNIGNDQMTRRPEDKMTRWPDDTMTRWPNDHIDQMTILTRWPDDHMTICSVTEKVRNSGLGPDPDQSAKNGPE